MKRSWCKSLLAVVLASTWGLAGSVAASDQVLRLDFSPMPREIFEAREQGGVERTVSSKPKTHSPATVGHGLTVHLPRTMARPGERWLEGEIHLSPTVPLARTQVRVRMTRLGDEKVLSEISAVPDRRSGRLWADVRRHGDESVRLRVELLEGGKSTGASEMLLTAESAPRPLKPGERVRVMIDLPDGAERAHDWPVTFGMPFASGALWDTGALRVVDDRGRELPAQMEVTGRWAPDGAIQWVRFDALVDSHGGCYVVVADEGPRAAPAHLLQVIEQPDGRIAVETGVSRYVLGGANSPVAEVWRGGRPIAEAGARGLYVVDQRGRLARATARGLDVRIESRGPVAACVRMEGDYATDDGEVLARHITRVEAFAGQPFARITHTLVLTRDSDEVWFKDIGWEWAVRPGAVPEAVFAASLPQWRKTIAVPLGKENTSAHIIQARHFRFGGGENVARIERVDAQGNAHEQYAGEEMGDWAALRGRQGGLMLACRDAALQHPKEFEVFADGLTLRLFSNRAGEELDFRGPALVERWNLSTWLDHTAGRLRSPEQEKTVAGRTTNAVGWSKTHELLLLPFGSGAPDERLAEQSHLHSRQVYGHVDPHWIYHTRVMGALYPRDPERFPEAEHVTDAVLEAWVRKVPDFGEWGFVDYWAGPHLGYHQSLWANPRRYPLTYTLRSDLWLAYARSSSRLARAFAEATNRSFMDNYVAHWDGGSNKPRGLWTGSGEEVRGGHGTADLPNYWYSSRPTFNLSSSTNLNQFIWYYQLTGYRRAADVLALHAAALAEHLTPRLIRRDWRAIKVLRSITQAYSMTWDPQFKAIAEAITDFLYVPEGALALTKERPFRSTQYKTRNDVFSFFEAWEVFGDQRYLDIGMRLGGYIADSYLASTPYTYTFPFGRLGNLLYDQAADPIIAQGMYLTVRHAVADLDMQLGRIRTSGRAHEVTFPLGDMGYALHVVADAEADRRPAASWATVIRGKKSPPVRLLLRKYENQKLDIAVDGPPPQPDGRAAVARVRPVDVAYVRGLSLVHTTQRGVDHPPADDKGRGGFARIEIPYDAAGGVYELDLVRDGDYLVLAAGAQATFQPEPRFGSGPDLSPAGGRVPMMLFAPEGLPTSVGVAPRFYFKVRAEDTGAAISFEGSAIAFDPDGKPIAGGEPRTGAVKLFRTGLWSFQPVEAGLVRTHNFPPFFAVEDPALYFDPPDLNLLIKPASTGDE